MFEVLFDLPMNLQFYVLLMSALLPISLHMASKYIDGSYHTWSFIENGAVYEKYIIKSLRYGIDLTFHILILCITKCIKRKDSPDGDSEDDHHLLFTS